MKIGLLTYHYTGSYGATLQTYATCKVLEELGHNVEIIDLRIDQNDSFLYKLVFSVKDYSTRKLWKSIYPSVSPFFPDACALKNADFDYDAIIVGSDQTWNPDISKDKYLSFFLDFGSDKIKRISYASSFGFSEWPCRFNSLIPQIKPMIDRFDAISTREESGQVILKKIFGKNSTLVLDPTLLIDDYSELSGDIKPNHKLISFIMNRSDNQLRRVLELGKLYGKKPVMTSTIYPYRGYSYQYPPSIGKWLKNIGGADFVVVDSFHALVFCLIYRKQFVVITPENGKNDRLVNLLALTGLNNRYFNDTDQNIPYYQLLNEKINYDSVVSSLRKNRDTSLNYLKENLK